MFLSEGKNQGQTKNFKILRHATLDEVHNYFSRTLAKSKQHHDIQFYIFQIYSLLLIFHVSYACSILG